MRKLFAGLLSLLMLAVVVQVFLAAGGAFDSAPTEEAFRPHRALGYAILLFALVLTALAALARMPGRLVGMTGLVAGLVVLQPVIAGIADALGDSGTTTTAGKLVFGLHGVNALGIMFVLGRVARQARAFAATPNAAVPGAAVSAAGGAQGGTERSVS
jgi:Family of unknown function (DUF6220)